MRASAIQTARRVWPNAAIKGAAITELPQPEHFSQLAEMVTDAMVADEVVCGPDPARHIQAVQEFVDAGFDHVYVHQVGPDQAGFMRFYERAILPNLKEIAA